jgi:hypothetical protein
MSKKIKNKNKDRGIHRRTIEDLIDRLTLKPYCDNFVSNYDYPFGELDILSWQGNRLVYYEVKSNWSKKQENKAYDQTQRWTAYARMRYPNLAHYGVLYTPQRGFKILAKNGYLR